MGKMTICEARYEIASRALYSASACLSKVRQGFVKEIGNKQESSRGDDHEKTLRDVRSVDLFVKRV